MIVSIAFFKGRGLRRDRFIRWWTNSPYSHVEIILPTNDCIGIRPPDSPNVRKKRFDNYSEAEWDIIELEATAEQLKAVTDFWELTRGQSYDWVGMVLSHILPFRIKRIDKWYCSEWVAYALGVSGIIDWRKMRLYSCGRLPPSFLYNVIACHKQGA